MTDPAAPPPPQPRPREPLWQSIAAALRADIAQGTYPRGDKLPTETALAARFGVNRHTVRHAIGHLVREGLVHPRRGAGVFVQAAPTDYPLGRRVRFHQNLAAAGQSAGRRILAVETRRARDDEAEALALAQGAPVHAVEGVSLADGQPLAQFRSVFPADRFPGLPAHLADHGSITAALAAAGLDDYTRASTRITAKIARGTRAELLMLAQGAPLLRTVAVNVDADGRPVEYGTTWFAGDRVTLVVAPD